jgi:UDP-N-acetylglucosamine:LPS N-acetylglucosamine transferase
MPHYRLYSRYENRKVLRKGELKSLMAKKKILVLTDHMPWGHRSIAKSIYQEQSALAGVNGDQYVYVEFKTNTTFGGALYTMISRYFPTANRMFHHLSKPKISRNFVKRMAFINLPGLKKQIEAIKPDLIISTYFFLADALQIWREKEPQPFTLCSVVPDPWSINPIAFVNGCDMHLVYDERSAVQAQKYGIHQKNILITGWWVRPEMYRQYDQAECRKKLGICSDRPVIFVGGGSLGTAAITRLLPTLVNLKKDVQFIINTGTDKVALEQIKRFDQLLQKYRKDDRIRILNLGWIDNMAEVLTASDIVFGKAGPNFQAVCGYYPYWRTGRREYRFNPRKKAGLG